QEITRIERKEDLHFIFEDADFSLATIKKLISQGEEDAENALAKKEAGSDSIKVLNPNIMKGTL
ncbi:MAG TPA: DUF3734 domain-containing protein, partial [Nitrososphaera sp.]|nr:DUF3734 domain-containing protein [Nitrososphaera sp.]